VSLNDVVVTDDVLFAFYSSHATTITSWLISADDSQVAWETDVDAAEKGTLRTPILFYHIMQSTGR